MAPTRVAASPSTDSELQRVAAPSATLDLEGIEAPIGAPEGVSGPAAASNGWKLQRAYGNQFVQRLANGSAVQGQRAGEGAGAEGGAVSPVVERRIERERGNGQPLPDGTRGTMQRSFGTDFSDVRVHTGSESTKLNRSLGARAFTTGSDVFFSDDEYSPETEDGQKLIAHELTHVVQQGGGDSASAQSAPNPQGKLTVGAADDPFEEEADALAERVVQRADPVNRKDEEEEAPLAASVTSAAVQTAIQREEEVSDASSEDEMKQIEDGGEGGEAEEEKPDAQEMKKMEDEGAQQGDKEGKQGEDAKAEAEGAAQSQAEQGGGVAEGAAADAAAGVEMPAEDGARAEKKEAETIEAELSDSEALTQESAQLAADDYSWETVKPPEWDAEVAFHEAFASAHEGGAATDPQAAAASALPAGMVNLQRKAAAGKLPRRLQRDLAPPAGSAPPAEQAGQTGGPAASEAAPMTATAVTQSEGEEAEPSPGSKYEGGGYVAQDKPGYVVPVPAHENVFANVIIGDTAGKGAEAINKFAMIGNETNGFGITAAVLEGLILLTEVITNILNYIILALAIVAGILFALGSLLAAFVFTAGAGAALISAAGSIMSVVLTLGKVVFWLTVGRLAMRAAALLFRGLDYWYAKANGATAEELRAKEAAMIGQAVGIAIDGVGLLIGGKPAPVGSIKNTAGQYVAKEVGKQIVKKVAIKGGTYGAKVGQQTVTNEQDSIKEAFTARDEDNSADPDAIDEIEQEAPAGMLARAEGEEEGGEVEEATLPAVPADAPQNVNTMAEHMAGVRDEKLSLQQRVMTIDDLLVSKGQWQQDMGTMQGELASNQSALKAGDVAMDEQMAAADEFASTAEKADAPSKEAKTSQAQAGGDLQAHKGSVDSASRRAENERPGATQGADKGQVEGGPAKGEEGAANAERLAAQGVQDAKASKAETQQVKEESQEAQGITADAQQSVSEKQDENLSEIEMLAADKEECLARLAELEGQEAELAAEHQSAVEYAGGWTAQHKEVREGSMAFAGAPAE